MLLKIVIYLLYITLFFAVNGFFFSEKYISKVYHLKEEEKFFSFIPRSFDRFIYTMSVGYIIKFIINFFFVKEERMKRIFIREMNNINELKYQIVQMVKTIKKRLISFFIFVFFIFIFVFLYVICFNFVYHFTQYEWIKSSIFIIIALEILIMIICLFSAEIRIISLKCKSERLFKLSNIINIF